MKVLWIATQALPEILYNISNDMPIFTGGWIEGAANIISSKNDIDLVYCFPYKKIINGYVNNVEYYTTYPIDVLRKKSYPKIKKETKDRFKYILEKTKPDIIQIWGTESRFQRAYINMAIEFGMKDKTVCWIQGLTRFCGEFYTSGLTNNEYRKQTMWEFLRGSSILGIKKRLLLNGKEECESINKLNHVFVRTDWDNAACKAINSSIKAHYCNESLRNEFYEEKKWNIDKIERYSIFLSQYHTPIKGMHMLLKAMEIIVKKFPQTILYTTGQDLFVAKSMINRLREPGYLKLLRTMIQEKKLVHNIKFLGDLNADEMRKQYLKTHVYVSSSFIENSSNALGEAMILGVPIVSSDVGGTSSVLTHKKEGFLYPYTDYTTLADYIIQIFENDNLAIEYSINAQKRAIITHNKKLNYDKLLVEYKNIINEAL